MFVGRSVANIDDGTILRKHGLNLSVGMMGRHGESAYRQPGIRLQLLTRTSIDNAFHGCPKLLADQISQPIVLLDDKQMIRRFQKKALADALAQLLQRIAARARHCDRLINQIVECHSIRLSAAREDSQATAAAALEPLPLHEVLISLAHGVVMHLQSTRKFANTR